MKKYLKEVRQYCLINILLAGVMAFFTMMAQAGTSLWTLTPLTATTVSVPANQSTIVQYLVTNKSKRPYTMTMTPIKGVTQLTTAPGFCGNPFTLSTEGAACILSLQVHGNLVGREALSGPVICNQGSKMQCYKPRAADVLVVNVIANQYGVGGTVSGLGSGNQVVLQNNNGDNLTVSANASFAFASAIADGTNYAVTVLSQPVGQTCMVSQGIGSINEADITNVMVTCTTNTYTLGGTVSGLGSGNHMVLQNNNGENLAISANGSFTFATAIADGTNYAVTVLPQPTGQTCTVTNGSGTITETNVTNVTVTCSTNSYKVGGMVSGLLSGEDVVLQDNNGDNLTVSANGSFNFATQIIYGGSYTVTVLTQPTAQTCAVTNSSGTVTSNVTNVSVTCVTNPTTLSASVSILALSVNCLPSSPCAGFQNAALTGNPRKITITNTGSNVAANVTYSASPSLPFDTSISPISCATVPPNGTCVFTITPGSNASASPGNTNPTPITLSISGDNTNTLAPEINILSYGSVYQGGYIYSVDDNYVDHPETGSIGGKVLTLGDQAPPFPNGIVWSSGGSKGSANPSGVSYDELPGIDNTSTPASQSPTYAVFFANFSALYSLPPSSAPSSSFGNCQGNADGFCNTNNIMAFYGVYQTNYGIAAVATVATPITDYAAGLCKQTINGYSDWYLPAICELGYDKTGAGTGCGSSSTPILQNIESNLSDHNIVPAFQGAYWSSTENSSDAQHTAWYQYLGNGAADKQQSMDKYRLIGVRCSRIF